MNICQFRFYRQFTFGFVLLALASFPADANEVSDVNGLLQKKDLPQALLQANSYLEKNPADVQMRFLKGLILSEQNESVQAIAVFGKLSEDHPELPEPYNNLAVLYASLGQFAQARTVLEKAIRINPSYEVAHENLGDIYVKLARHSYNNMLQLDPGNLHVRLKYALVGTVIDQAASVPAPTRASIADPAAATAAVEVRTVATPVQTVQAHAAEGRKTSDDLVAKVELARVQTLISAWARAWSERDVNAYLAFYGFNFRGMNQEARVEWEKKRRANIGGKRHIRLRIEVPNVTLDGNKAKADFIQHYSSSNHASRDRKTLLLEQQDGEWKIVDELAAK